MAQTQPNQQNQNQQQMQQAQMQGQEARVTAEQMRGQPLTGGQRQPHRHRPQQIVMGRSGQSYAVVEVQDGQSRLLPTEADHAA